MPRFFFNVYNDVIAIDDEGAELGDENAARLCAITSARGLIAEQVQKGYFILSNRIEVCGQSGQHLLTVRFGDAVDIRE